MAAFLKDTLGCNDELVAEGAGCYDDISSIGRGLGNWFIFIEFH